MSNIRTMESYDIISIN